MKIEFQTCPNCAGYGVRDNGANCTTCGGKGRGGLHGSGTIGSGEIMIDKETGRRVTAGELVERMEAAAAKYLNESGEARP